MPHTPNTPSASAQASSDKSDPIESRLSEMQDIADEAKKNKVQLTPEIQSYIHTHLEAVQQKLADREPVTEDDLKFMQDVRLWVSLPEDWRGKYRSIEDMNKSEEIRESRKREISIKQWLDLLRVAEVKGEKKKWIAETFRFPGGGRIETNGDLDISYKNTSIPIPGGYKGVGNNLPALEFLPAGLKVNGNLNLSYQLTLKSLPSGLEVSGNLDLINCLIKSIPADMKVNGNLILEGCVRLESFPRGLKVGRHISLFDCYSLKSLPENLEVNGYLNLNGCTALTSLPANLKVGDALGLSNCTSLTSLPANMNVNGDLGLNKKLNEQVKKDAERLKEEEKIKGNIKYL